MHSRWFALAGLWLVALAHSACSGVSDSSGDKSSSRGGARDGGGAAGGSGGTWGGATGGTGAISGDLMQGGHSGASINGSGNLYGGDSGAGSNSGGSASNGAGSNSGGSASNGAGSNSGGRASSGAGSNSGGSASNGAGSNSGAGGSNAGAASAGSVSGGSHAGGSVGVAGATSPAGGSASNGGATTSGGSGSNGHGGGGSGGGGGPFVLAWQDDFNTLDASLWQLQTFTFEGNQAQFSTENARVANGVLTISLTKAPSGSAKPFLGVEMRSSKTVSYGKVSARMRFAKGSGVVSGLVLFYTPFPNCEWNEIDIEHLGNSSNSSQLNAMVYTGAAVPNCTASVTPTQDPFVANLGFNAETDFHVYDIEWTRAGVKYYADGKLLRNWTSQIDRLRLPQNILLTIWASASATWAGAVDANSAPTSADIDWIKVYGYSG